MAVSFLSKISVVAVGSCATLDEPFSLIIRKHNLKITVLFGKETPATLGSNQESLIFPGRFVPVPGNPNCDSFNPARLKSDRVSNFSLIGS